MLPGAAATAGMTRVVVLPAGDPEPVGADRRRVRGVVGPKRPSKLTAAVVADVPVRRGRGQQVAGIAALVGVSQRSVAPVLAPAGRRLTRCVADGAGPRGGFADGPHLDCHSLPSHNCLGLPQRKRHNGFIRAYEIHTDRASDVIRHTSDVGEH